MLFLAFVVLSCSKSSPSIPQNLVPSYQNLAGKWYISKVVKLDNSIVAAPGLCATKRDFVTFYVNARIVSNIYLSCTSSQDLLGCDGYFVDGIAKRIWGCQSLENGTITDFTTSTLSIDYDNPVSLDMYDYEVKAVIFTRE